MDDTLTTKTKNCKYTLILMTVLLESVVFVFACLPSELPIKQVLLLFSLLYTYVTLAIYIIDGHGLCSKRVVSYCLRRPKHEIDVVTMVIKCSYYLRYIWLIIMFRIFN